MKTKQVEYTTTTPNLVGYLYNFANINEKPIYKSQLLERGFEIMGDLSDALAMMNDNAQDSDIAYHLLMVIADCEEVLSHFDQEEVNETLYTVRDMHRFMEDAR